MAFIHFENICKSFGQNQVLRGISMEIAAAYAPFRIRFEKGTVFITNLFDFTNLSEYRVRCTMQILKEKHLLFGAACCYTKKNVELIGSDRYFDSVIGWGAKFMWCFSYTPIGKGAETDLMSKKLYLAATDETVPFERFETGALQYGCGDPENPEYYSLADFCSSGSTVEIRLPWNLIGFMDPSQKLVIGDFHSGSEIASAVTEGVRVGAFREGGTGPVTMLFRKNERIYGKPKSGRREACARISDKPLYR